MPNVDGRDEGCGTGHGLDRFARAQPGEQRDESHRLNATFFEGIHAERTKPLGELPFGAGQQRLMRELWRGRAQRHKHLQLRGCIGHMVLTPHDMRDAHVDIIDGRGQHVEPRTVRAADDGV